MFFHVSVHGDTCSFSRVLHEQLIHELPEERFTEKRVNLLKSQVAQLERQVCELNHSLDHSDTV